MTTGKCQCLPEFFERKKKCLPGKTMPPCPAGVVNNNNNDNKLNTTVATTRLLL